MHCLNICLVGTCLLVISIKCEGIDVSEKNSEQQNKHRDVVFIVVDDLRPALGVYGDKKSVTPNIDALAANGLMFENVYAQQALCAPSRNSLLTSRRPDSLRLYDFYSYWRTDGVGNFTTLPQYLKANGYETISLGKVFHPGASSNFTDDYPVSWSSIPFHSPSERFMNKPVCLDPETGELVKNVVCPVQIPFQPLETLPDIETIRKAKDILVNRSIAKPLFLAVGLHKPHIPLRFPAHYLDLHEASKFHEPNFNYVPHDLPTVAFNPFTDIRSRADARRLNITFPFGPIPHPFGVSIRQAYYAAVSYVDDLIGDLIRSIDLERTVVVLTSDHGWSLGEHAEWAKYSNYDVALRVPLILHDPQLTAKLVPKHKRRINNVVELLDIFPTIVDLCQLTALPMCESLHEEQCCEGRSLIPMLHHAEPLNASLAFSQYPRPADYPQEDSDRPRLAQIKIMGYSVRTYQFRYTIWIGFDYKSFKRDWKRLYGEELYDHTFDSGENLNLVTRPEMKGIRRSLRRLAKQRFP